MVSEICGPEVTSIPFITILQAKIPETKNQTYDFTFPCIWEGVFKEEIYQDKRQELTVHLEDEESSLT